MDRIAELEKALYDINACIYANGAPLGSSNYFFIRQRAVDALGLERMREIDRERPNDQQP